MTYLIQYFNRRIMDCDLLAFANYIHDEIAGTSVDINWHSKSLIVKLDLDTLGVRGRRLKSLGFRKVGS